MAFKKQGNGEQGIGNREEDLSLFLTFVGGGKSRQWAALEKQGNRQ